MSNAGVFSPISREALARGIREQLAEQHQVSTDPRWLAPFAEMTPQTGAAGTAKPEGQAAPTAEGMTSAVGPGGETVATDGQPGPSPQRDGRHVRSDVSKVALVAACRRLMADNDFDLRPSMTAICRVARLSVRSGFQHFRSVAAIHTEALRDQFTREAVLDRIVGPQVVFLTEETRNRVLRAIYVGR